MALRDQPYIPLYIQDIMTCEKLNECSAATHGIFIKGIMCLMHKSEIYGTLLLKQKYKQDKKQSKNLASQLVKHLPYTELEIETAIDELLLEKVCFLDGDYLCQNRMIKDNDLSMKRAKSGSKGGIKTTSNFAKAKPQANSENENEDSNSVNNKDTEIFDDMYQTDFEKARKLYPGSKRGLKTEFDYFKHKIKDWKNVVTMLAPAIERQISIREKKITNKEWVPEWKGFSSWIFNRFWEMEMEELKSSSAIPVG